ncbi:MAG: STAS domain-containing protein [Chloroflexi bacterium]|nr:STAS domain-containing protein [Chloroflexota bacterium]
MQATQVKLNVRKVSDAASIVDISGEITAAAESALTTAYTQASGEFTRAIILNFSELEYMNSSGIGLLVTMLIRANRQKQKLCVFGLNDHYKQIFALTRLNEAIKIYESEKDALASA